MASGGQSDTGIELRKRRTLTEHGEFMLETKVNMYTKTLEDIKHDIDLIIKDIELHPLDRISDISDRKSQAQSLSSDLQRRLEIYKDTTESFCQYLNKVRSKSAAKEKCNTIFMQDVLESAVQNVIEKLDRTCSDQFQSDVKSNMTDQTENKNTKSETFPETKGKSVSHNGKAKSVKSKISAKSKLSSTSSSSSMSSVYMKQKAKLEEARMRLKFVKKEAELLKEQAELNARLKVLDSERQCEEYAQGLSAMDEFLDSDDNNSNTSELSDTIRSRTKEFVENSNFDNLHSLNVEAPTFVPKNQRTVSTDMVVPKNQRTESSDMCMEISKYIVKKDMLLKRIHEFDDKPEFFGSWKRTFIDIVLELGLTAAEEVDLLIRYLGPESKKSAMSIQSANYSDPFRAKERIWQRLNDCFAMPEMVEASIKQKLVSFEKITNKDPKRLYELVDIVSEIDSLKRNEQYRSLFASYDSSAGVNMIITKLPYQLQEKWTNEASRYKEENSAAFPPFHVFSSFLERMVRRKNGPSFTYEELPKPKRAVGMQSVLVKKTDVPSSTSSGFEVRGPLTLCPLHKTSHTINKCHQFRQKPMQERLEFLKSKGLCFKCCGQKAHLAKDCRSTVKCGICKATTHATALHEDKGEQTVPKQVDSTSHESPKKSTTLCTTVCRHTGSSKSCAKTILAKVYPKGKPEQAIDLYAIIDEQSTNSLARSSFFDHFSISGPEESYLLKSCSGDTIEYGRRCSDFVMESIDSSCKITCLHLLNVIKFPILEMRFQRQKQQENILISEMLPILYQRLGMMPR